MLNHIKLYFTELPQVIKSGKQYLRLDIILAILYIASLISPTLTALTRLNFAYPVFFIVYIGWFISVNIYYKKQGKSFTVDKQRLPEMIALLVWLAIAAVYAFIRPEGQNGYWAIIYTVMFMTVYMMDYVYTTYMDRKVMKVLILAMMAIFAFDSLRGCLILQQEAFASRVMNATYAENFERFFALELRGLGDYPFFTASAIALPVFFYYVIKSERKLIMTIMYSLILAGIFYSGYTGSTMLVFVMLLFITIFTLFFYKNKKRKKQILFLVLLSIIVILLVLLVLIPADLQAEYFVKYRDLLKFILGVNDVEMPKITLNPQLGGNKEDYATLGYRTASRVSFYYVSLKSFLQHPLFGVGAYFKTATVANGVGNHSSWLDFLAMYGLVGCLPLIICFVLIYKRNMSCLKFRVNRAMRVLPWMFFMGYGFVNPVFVARCFPAVFGLAVVGDSDIGQELIPLKEWLRFKKK